MNNQLDCKVIACLIARMKSVRLPKKSLAEINGKPMTLQLIERLRSSSTIDDIIICTSAHADDAVLLQLATNWGVKALAGSEDDVLSRLIEAAEQSSADIVIRVTGDNVLTCPEMIDRMVRHHVYTGADYTRTCNLPLGATAEIMSASMLQPLHDLMPDPRQSEYMLWFSFDPDHFHCEVMEPPQDVKRPYYSITVDTPKDIELIRYLYSRFPRPSGPRLTEVITALDEDPSRCTISKDTRIKAPGGESITYQEFLEFLADLKDKADRINLSKL